MWAGRPRHVPQKEQLDDSAAVLRGDARSGPHGTVPELLFEQEQLIPALQQLLLRHTEAPGVSAWHRLLNSTAVGRMTWCFRKVATGRCEVVRRRRTNK